MRLNKALNTRSGPECSVHSGPLYSESLVYCVLIRGGVLRVFHLFNDSLESCGIVEGEVGEDLAVDLDTALVDEAHEL